MGVLKKLIQGALIVGQTLGRRLGLNTGNAASSQRFQSAAYVWMRDQLRDRLRSRRHSPHALRSLGTLDARPPGSIHRQRGSGGDNDERLDEGSNTHSTEMRIVGNAKNSVNGKAHSTKQAKEIFLSIKRKKWRGITPIVRLEYVLKRNDFQMNA
jgi:hypothetical protein